MILPSIEEYKDSIMLAESAFRSLRLGPIIDSAGRPFLVTGNFAVTFKMRHLRSNRLKAIKCYTRLSSNHQWRLQELTRYFKQKPSGLVAKPVYLEKELWVGSRQTNETEFPVLMMDWVGEMTLGQYVNLLCRQADKTQLKQLAEKFDEFAVSLLQQDFAHGDLKPDNIVVYRDPLRFRLIDLDGLFLSGISKGPALENGSPGYRHPRRDLSYYDASVDDFPLLLISTSLHLLAEAPAWHDQYSDGDNLLFTETALRSPADCPLFREVETSMRSRACQKRMEQLFEALHNPPGPIPNLPKLLLTKPEGNLSLRYAHRYDLISSFHEGLAMVGKRMGARNGYRYGFIDEQGNEQIPPRFNNAKHFSEGLAAASQRGKWGYIDQQGQWKIPPIYEEANSFANGFSQVKLEGKWGYLRPDGHLFLRCIYEDCRPFLHGAFEVRYRGRWVEMKMKVRSQPK